MNAFRAAVSSLNPNSLGDSTYQSSSLGSDVDFHYPSGWSIKTRGHWDKVFDSLGSDLKDARDSRSLRVTQEALRQMFTTLSEGLAKRLPHRALKGVTVSEHEPKEVSYQGPMVTLDSSTDGVYVNVKFKIPCPPTDGKKANKEDREICISIPGTCKPLSQLPSTTSSL